MKVLANGTSVIISQTAPTIDPDGLHTTSDYWHWLDSTSGRMYQWVDGDWTLIGEGVNAEPTTDEVKITHLKVVNGLITELEWEDMGE